MNYEFHVGDYVETVGGLVGYVAKVQPIDEGLYVFFVKYKDHNEYEYNLCYDELQRFFKRIGAYDFTKKEKKKIMRLSEADSWLTFRNTNKANVNLCYIIKRINELVDAVNKLMEKEDEERTTMN